jgi:hypothetical protein
MAKEQFKEAQKGEEKKIEKFRMNRHKMKACSLKSSHSCLIVYYTTKMKGFNGSLP